MAHHGAIRACYYSWHSEYAVHGDAQHCWHSDQTAVLEARSQHVHSTVHTFCFYLALCSAVGCVRDVHVERVLSMCFHGPAP